MSIQVERSFRILKVTGFENISRDSAFAESIIVERQRRDVKREDAGGESKDGNHPKNGDSPGSIGSSQPRFATEHTTQMPFHSSCKRYHVD